MKVDKKTKYLLQLLAVQYKMKPKQLLNKLVHDEEDRFFEAEKISKENIKADK